MRVRYLLFSFLSGALGAGLVLFLSGTLQLPSIPSSAPSGQQAAVDPIEASWEKVQAGRLQEAQNDYVQILLRSGGHSPRALNGLVMIRRRLAHDDPEILRRQAAEYRHAIAQNVETDEHYTSAAMEVLATASQLAANELEAERLRSPLSQNGGTAATAPPAPSTPQAAAQAPPPPPRTGSLQSRPPAPIPTALGSHAPQTQTPLQPSTLQQPTTQVTPSPRGSPLTALASPTPPPSTPQPTTTPPAGATAPTSSPALMSPVLNARTPFYVLQVGPVSDAEYASEIVRELISGGFLPRWSRREEPYRFHVISDMLTRLAAERRAVVLAQQGVQANLRALASGLAQLDFGVFSSREAAEALAKRIRSQGYPATIAREGGTSHTITLGPYRQPSADVIVQMLRTRFGADLGVTVSRAGQPPSEQTGGK